MLQLHAERAIASNAAGRKIATPDAGAVHVQRAVVDEVLRAVSIQDLLLVAEAGAGKTAVLLDSAERLIGANERVVFLDATDRRLLDARSLLGLQHPLEDVLQRWGEGDRPGYLIIDGLDAIRSSPAFDALLRLVRVVQHGATPWRVLAATRDYDLESAVQLRALFAVVATPVIGPEFTDARFSDVTHIAVRGLSDAEFAALGAQSAALGGLLEEASNDLRRLLRNPFNLSIAARLIDKREGLDLSTIRTRVQLLDLWWKWRVDVRGNASTAGERESRLRTLCTAMLDQRDLRISVEHCQSDGTMDELFSDGVVAKLGRYGDRVAFAHAIIFDYAVYRLFLQTASVATFLKRDRELALFSLPSIRMRLNDLWDMQRDRFFQEMRGLFLDKHRRTLLMAAARTIVECSRDVSDVKPLLEYNDDAGSMAVRYLVRILIYLHQRGLRIVGETAGPWAALALGIAKTLPSHEHDGLLVLDECLRDTEATNHQQEMLALAARLFLRLQLRPSFHEPVRARMAITSFLKTYDVAPQKARPYLDRLLDHNRIERFGRYELEPLGYGLKALHNPNALLAVYRAVFSEINVGSGKVDMGRRSVVMSMVQDASQTLSSARWALGERFSQFLQDSPSQGVQALASVLERETQRRRRYKTMMVRFSEKDVVLGHDCSNVRDSETYSHEPWYAMLRCFEEQLRDALSAGDCTLFEVAFDKLTTDVHGMHLWRVLLLHAGSANESASLLAPLAASDDALLAWELGEPVAEYLKYGYARLPEEKRAAIDTALLRLVSEDLPAERREYRERRRTELILGMPLDAIVVPELRAIAELAHNDKQRTPHERELTLSGSSISGEWRTAPALSEEARRSGADNRLTRAIDAARPLLTFASGQTLPSGTAILPAIDRIEEAAIDAPDEARGHALDVICALIRGGLEHKLVPPADYPRLINLLLQSIAHAEPETGDDERDLNDETLSWGSPWRFADGALALGYLLQHSDDSRVVDALRRLASYARANVRYLAISSSRPLVSAQPIVAAEFAQRGVADPAIGVLHAGLDIGLRLYHADPVTSRRLTYDAFDRILERTQGSDITIRSILKAMLHFKRDGATDDNQRLLRLTEQPWQHPHVAVILAGVLADNLRLSNAAEERSASQTILLEVVSRCANRVRELLAKFGGDVDSYSADNRQVVEACLRILQNAAERLSFASQTIEHVQAKKSLSDNGNLEAAHFALLHPILKILASVPFGGTAYNVIKTLLGAIDSHPTEALDIAALAVRSAGSGIASDHFAEDDVRSFTLRFIREQRGHLSTEPSALSNVMDIVDVFVDAGWPQWIDVFFELDRIYRE
jgi:hypothetical protein